MENTIDDFEPPMPPPTPEEIKAYREAAMNCAFPKGWVWDEEKISYAPPFPPPDAKYPYLWNEETLAWDPFPGYPRDE
jgi:hypothetical protein